MFERKVRAAIERWRQQAGELRLTSRGWSILGGALASLLAANWWAIGQLNYIGCLLAGLMLFSTAYVFLGHSHVRIERTFLPDVVAAGEHSTTTLEVRNLSVFPSLEAHWKDHLPSTVVGHARGSLPALGSGRSRSAKVGFTYEVRGGRRGEHLVGPLSISLPDPFGLIERQRGYGEPSVLTVLPKTVELLPISLNAHGIDGPTHLAHRHVGAGVDDVIAREYMPGDPMRHLHWKATARRAELMVRQEEQLNNPKATIVLNAEAVSFGAGRGWSDATDEGHLPAFEWAVIEAASFCSSLVSANYGVAFRTVGDARGCRREVSDDHASDTIEDVMVDLARIAPSEGSTVTPAILEAELSAESPTPLVAILGTLNTTQAAEWVAVGHACTSAVAYLGSHTPDEAVELLERSGWTCRSAATADELLDSWLSLDMRQGVRHGAY